MNFPDVPRPPDWYWKLPLKWRQRYCRWFVWKWEAVRRFCVNILSRETLFCRIPNAVAFTRFCWAADRRDGISRRESADYLATYWRDCWRYWINQQKTEVR